MTEKGKFQKKMGITYEQFFSGWALGITGITKELEQVLGKEKTLKILGNAFEKIAVVGTPKIKNFGEFIALQKEVIRNPVNTKIAISGKITEETPKKLAFCFTECLWANVFKKMNATDIGYIMCCRPDFAIAKAINPKLKLERTKTLMRGDSRCDHTYFWKE